MVLSLDFGGSSVKYALVDEKSNIKRSGKAPAPLASKEQFADTVFEIYEGFKEQTEGIGISLPGYIDGETGTLAGSGAYMNLYGCNIPELIRTKIDINVAVENDGKCGALAETWTGALADCKDGVVLILGSGIAGGVIKNRKIHSGYSLAAGEFSNFIVDAENPSFMGLAVMNCAAAGLTYRLCKAKNLDLSYQDLGEILVGIDRSFGSSFPEFSEPPKKIKADGKQLEEWIKRGDEPALEVYGNFLSKLAFMIENIQITYAPEKIVIGGGLSRLSMLMEDLRKTLDSLYAKVGFGDELKANIVRSVQLDECNLLGAARNYYLKYGNKTDYSN